MKPEITQPDRLTENDIKELRDLHSQGITDIDNEAVRSSKFYQRIQTVEFFSASNLKLNEQPEEVILLMVKIVAASPTIWRVGMCDNNLGPLVVQVAKILAISKTICDVWMSCDDEYVGAIQTASPNIFWQLYGEISEYSEGEKHPEDDSVLQLKQNAGKVSALLTSLGHIDLEWAIEATQACIKILGDAIASAPSVYEG